MLHPRSSSSRAKLKDDAVLSADESVTGEASAKIPVDGDGYILIDAQEGEWDHDDEFTLTFWSFLSAFPNNDGDVTLISFANEDDDGLTIALSQESDNRLEAEMEMNTGRQELKVEASLGTMESLENGWHHWAIVCKDDDVSVYFDGGVLLEKLDTGDKWKYHNPRFQLGSSERGVKGYFDDIQL